jgi:hypothetical protein
MMIGNRQNVKEWALSQFRKELFYLVISEQLAPVVVSHRRRIQFLQG